MKRDLDLVRKILFVIEENEDATGRSLIAVRIEGYPEKQIFYHLKLLDEAGLIEAVDFSGGTQLRWEAQSLTWDGHEFLDSARSETLWKEAKKQMKNIGSSSFQVLLQILLKLAESKIPS